MTDPGAYKPGVLAALLWRATPSAMGGTPDLNYPDCPLHGYSCPDPWDCYEKDVKAYLAIIAAIVTGDLTSEVTND